MTCDHKVICFQLGFGSSQYCSELKSAFSNIGLCRDNIGIVNGKEKKMETTSMGLCRV